MSQNSPALGPNQGRRRTWSELPTAHKAAGISILVVLVLCFGAVIGAFGDDSDPDSPAELATESETTASETPSEPDPTTAETSAAAPTTSSEPEPEPETTEAEEEEVYYENCAAAREAGADPVYEDEPGYGSHLDSDGDGVGCEQSSGSDSGGGDGGGDGGSDDDDDDDGGSDVYYENCDAVRAAGAAPIHSGDPGYGSHLDRDGDGVGCE